jgi:hypothetical protein
MYGDTADEAVKTEQVMFVTLREVIEGTLYHNENVRLSDALNAESRHHSRYITLKDATIYSISTGREILKTAFLLVSHSHVIYMTPKGCVQTSATANIQAAQQAAMHQAALQHAANQAASAPHVSQHDDVILDAWQPIAAADVEPATCASSPELLEASKVDYHLTTDASAMARQAVVLGTDSHLLSRQSMLQALESIRGHSMEPPRRASRLHR